ncbi:MAG: hypothetical protein K0B85_08650 [Coriobacteriia bacterium]|nr:hypothetical protein [Coriobacteriia bacterium]
MKRVAIVAVLTCGLVFALAGVAMAAWGGASPTSYYNVKNNDPVVTTGYNRERPVYVMWEDVLDTYNAGAGTWDGTAFFNSGEFNTPHKGYDTTTTLCAVCHSVHWAPVYDGNSRVSYSAAVDAWDGEAGAAGWSEKLLRTSAGNACNYCHIETSIGGIQIYAGDTSLYGYKQNFENSFAHDYHGSASEGCTVCHSVHGANTFDGALGGKILHQATRPRPGHATEPFRLPQPETIGDMTNSLDPTTGDPNTIEPVYETLADAYTSDDRWKQQTVFCSTCHYAYSDDSTTAHAIRGGTAFVKSHPMVEANGSTAFEGSGTCRSCHDAGGVNQYKGAIDEAIDNIPTTGYSSNNFPHYTAGNYRFLDQGGLGMENAIDKSCIKCHQQGADGVGLTF